MGFLISRTNRTYKEVTNWPISEIYSHYSFWYLNPWGIESDLIAVMSVHNFISATGKIPESSLLQWKHMALKEKESGPRRIDRSQVVNNCKNLIGVIPSVNPSN